MEFEPLGIGNDVIEFDMIGLGVGYDTIDIEHPVEEGQDKQLIDPFDNFESTTVFRVAKFGESHKSYLVHYNVAIESRYEKEVKAKIMTPCIMRPFKTPSPTHEKQASEIYTRKSFMKFQEELVETLTFLATKVDDKESTTVFRVAKFGESHKSYLVHYNVGRLKHHVVAADV
ncbi:hypothetical protein RND71_019405 [Anisodus tanguticus]|uniref:Protein FAR1-RELATED SEQUENCE n=1 Tax=Anisodus tanguticus TaxID=243964 RepID=A0AAE1S0H0_9SOLA|nr:hypothetical protein RND71_019405 [Anisodus tanguticus]